MTMTTSPAGVAALAAHEGFVPGPYLDSVGVWTVYVGHTKAAGSPDPAAMPRGMPADLDAAVAEGVAVFRRDLAKYEAAVRSALGGMTVAQHEFDAAVSFHFNTGAIGTATWVKTWKSGRKAQAAAEMMNWRRPTEIIPRREAERDLFQTGKYPTSRITVWGVTSAGRVVWTAQRTYSAAEFVALIMEPPADPIEARFAALEAENAALAERVAHLETKLIGAGL